MAYFVSTQTEGRKPFFRHERWARLMVDVLKHYEGTGYALHAYVVMPDHLHLLLTPVESIEKSVQLFKGGFSFRAKRELEWPGGIWQTGFTDHRIRDEEDWNRHLEYIRMNPVEARLVFDSVLYEYMGFPSSAFPRGLKPGSAAGLDVRAEARTLQSEHAGSSSRAEHRIPSGAKAPFAMRASNVRAEARTLQSGSSDSLGRAEHRIPSGAKAPFAMRVSNVRAEARTLQSEHAGSLGRAEHRIPSGAKAPFVLRASNVRAEARTLQSGSSDSLGRAEHRIPSGAKAPFAMRASNVRAEARTLHPESRESR
ncbi:MAG: transposase [Terracidiphilus sp.]